MNSLAQSAPVVTLYQPTHAEVQCLFMKARTAWPQISSRLDKAQDILLSGGIGVDPVAWQLRNAVQWRIASQSTSATYTYIIVSGHCACADRAPVVNGRKVCKHAITVEAYRRILRDKLNAAIQARKVDLGILPNGQFHVYATRCGYVEVKRYSTGVYDFVSDASAIHFSVWLAAQQPPVPKGRAGAVGKIFAKAEAQATRLAEMAAKTAAFLGEDTGEILFA
jgi:hypothetical protein